ncbi:restriction endonuclease subunit S [Achromobacter aegrifaciens]|uniref:restriction endonuclease subunit S n=1 Tax=Achromobacter aegrifaciens TaxID=1287736 RepID=UPI0027926519|nr:restriction endonuclease subunit S [Achromobacter aegrifaciens]MDQ1759062.1 restriction endonuclease subunit S [Achromobacter aegrifaciens]
MSLPRYPKYKDSGVAWLGQVPHHWTVRRLGSCFEERREKVSDKDFPPLSVTKLGVVPQLESAAKTDDGDNRKKVCAGDFVINSRSDRKGSSGASQLDGSVSLINTVLEPVEGVSIEFVHHLLRSVLFQEEFYRYGKGIVADLWSTNYSEMRNITLALPNVGEQTAIAVFLDRKTAKIDALIAEQEKLIALLAEKRQATISHAVTRGLNPDAQMKDSDVKWLGDMPAHWDVVPLKYLVDLRSGGTPSKDNLDYWDGDIPWASAKDLKVEKLGDTADHITQKAIEDGAASLVRSGAVLVVVRGMILARTFPVVETLVHLAINQDLKAVLPRDRVNVSFLAWLLRGSANESLQRLDEAGHGTKALRMDAWTSMELPIPPLAEQIQIAEFISKKIARLDTLCAEAERAISLLNERRSALIAAAVTGQIDVR